MELIERVLRCSCGGTLTVKIPESQKDAVAECACGKTVFWAAEPPPLGISVADEVKTSEAIG